MPCAPAKVTSCSAVRGLPSIHQIPVRLSSNAGSRNMLPRVPSSKGGRTPAAMAFAGSICSGGDERVAHCVVSMKKRTQSRRPMTVQRQQPQHPRIPEKPEQHPEELLSTKTTSCRARSDSSSLFVMAPCRKAAPVHKPFYQTREPSLSHLFSLSGSRIWRQQLAGARIHLWM